ncbi:MAG: hypothetical protein WC850_06130 [Candidatus Gracilibacteria bacterium]
MIKSGRYVKIIFIVLFILSIFGKVSASTGVTIVELKQNIAILQEKQKDIYQKTPDLSSVSDVKEFLKDDITISQIEEINKIIKDYNEFKVQKDVLDYEKKLLNIKKETYKKIIIFVDTEKSQDYLDYIKDSLEAIKQDNIIKDEIYKNKEILDEKILVLKEKIKINNDEFESDINVLITTKIDEKLQSFKDNKDFQKLDLEKRKYILDRIIKNVQIKKEKKVSSGVNVGKIELYVYDLLIEKLQEFLLELK